VAADGTVAWATRAGGSSQSLDSGRAVAVDAAGNPYIAGSFGATADFGSTTLTSGSGYPAAFAARLDAATGAFTWARGTRVVSGSGQLGEEANGIAVGIVIPEAEPRVSVTGEYRGTVDFDPNAGTTTLSSLNRRGGFSSADAFVWQLDGAGNLRWARSVGGNELDVGRDVAVDAAGNVYAVGSLGGSADVDPGKGKYTLTGGGHYLLKLTGAGAFVWARGGVGVPIGEQLSIDAGNNLYLTGTFSGTADFNPGSGAYNLTSAGGTDAFVRKLDLNANFVWAVSAGGTGDDRAAGLAVSGANVWATGWFTGTADFDPGAGQDLLTTPDVAAFTWKLTQA
jgi:hypothetical protein